MTNAAASSRKRSIWERIFAVCAGLTVALLGHQLLQLQLRHLIAVIVGTILLTCCLVAIRRLPDVLMFAMVMAIPLFTFEKSFFTVDKWVDFGTPGINVGPLDVVLFPLYVLWSVEVVALRSRGRPKFHGGDAIVLLFLLANIASLMGTASVRWTTFEIFRIFKYFLAYFYLAHRLERRHLPAIVGALLFALLFESALGVFQHQTHKLTGIGRSKGAFTAEMDVQYEVPEFEGNRRAEGTTIDSHALGAYLVFLLIYPLAIALAPWVKKSWRWICAIAFLGGLPGLVATFSRGAWGGFAIALGIVLITFYVWKVKQALKMFLLLSIFMVAAGLIGGGALLGKRIFRAPSEIMSARWDTILSGWEMFCQNPLTGRGANAYFHAQAKLGRVYDLTNDKPPHNIAMFILAQMGLFGLLAYAALVGYAIRQGWKLMQGDDITSRLLGLAVFAGMIGVQADGIVDFMAFTNQVLFMHFFSCALVAALVHEQMASEA